MSSWRRPSREANGDNSLRRRVSFDIGSGATKALVADTDPGGAIVGACLFEMEKPLPFKADAQANDGSLSEQVQAEGIALIEEMLAAARSLGANEACAVGMRCGRTYSRLARV